MSGKFLSLIHILKDGIGECEAPVQIYVGEKENQSMKHFRRDIKLTEIIFATGNKDKMREIREIMADCDRCV